MPPHSSKIACYLRVFTNAYRNASYGQCLGDILRALLLYKLTPVRKGTSSSLKKIGNFTTITHTHDCLQHKFHTFYMLIYARLNYTKSPHLCRGEELPAELQQC